jgi:hypothetical protein
VTHFATNEIRASARDAAEARKLPESELGLIVARRILDYPSSMLR